MPEEHVEVFKKLSDLFQGVFEKVLINHQYYLMIPFSKMQRVTDYLLVMDIKLQKIEEHVGLKEKEPTVSMKELDKRFKRREIHPDIFEITEEGRLEGDEEFKLHKGWYFWNKRFTLPHGPFNSGIVAGEERQKHWETS